MPQANFKCASSLARGVWGLRLLITRCKMGDKSPKSKDKNKKQDAKDKNDKRAALDKKQTPPAQDKKKAPGK